MEELFGGENFVQWLLEKELAYRVYSSKSIQNSIICLDNEKYINETGHKVDILKTRYYSLPADYTKKKIDDLVLWVSDASIPPSVQNPWFTDNAIYCYHELRKIRKSVKMPINHEKLAFLKEAFVKKDADVPNVMRKNDLLDAIIDFMGKYKTWVQETIQQSKTDVDFYIPINNNSDILKADVGATEKELETLIDRTVRLYFMNDHRTMRLAITKK